MRVLSHVSSTTLHLYCNRPKYVCWYWTPKKESAWGRPPADTARSHAQPCWLGIQLRCRAARGARCSSDIRLRRVAHTAPGTGPAPFTTGLPESILPVLTCMYMYRYIFTSTHVCVDVNIYLYMYTYMYMCSEYICTHTHTYKNMFMLPHVCRTSCVGDSRTGCRIEPL